MSPPREFQWGINPAVAIPLTEPDWDPNCGGLAFLEHYRKSILEGLKKGVPTQKSLNMICTLQQNTNEDLTEFLERLYQAYGKHTNADLRAPEDVWIVNMTFIQQNAWWHQTGICTQMGAASWKMANYELGMQ